MVNILYSCVSRRTLVLARYASCLGNFSEITQLVLSRVSPTDPQRMTMHSGNYAYHYVQHEGGLLFLCITDEGFDRVAAFAFLDAVAAEFAKSGGGHGASGGGGAAPYELDEAFSSVMAAEMKKANRGRLGAQGRQEEDKIEKLKDEVRQVREVMATNIDNIVERGERLDLLVDKTEMLSNESVSFRQASRQVQRKMWWQNIRMKVIIGCVVVLVVYGAVSFGCGGMLWPKCV